jgi:hypothetical protein
MGQPRREKKYSNEIKEYDFTTDYGTHHMMAIPHKINEDTGMGEIFNLGVPKLKALISPENLIKIRKYVERFPEEAAKQIAIDAHVGKEWKDRE